jgi:hypothetical protein
MCGWIIDRGLDGLRMDRQRIERGWMEDEWRLEGGWVEDGLRDGWKGRAVVVVVGDGYLAVAEEDWDGTVAAKVYAGCGHCNRGGVLGHAWGLGLRVNN